MKNLSKYSQYKKLYMDLHTHSNASDGQYTPTELVQLAKNRGLDILALTDHDTLDGLNEAVQAGLKYNIRVLRGIELSAKEYRGLHILGYHISTDAPALEAFCAELKAGRDQRKYRILDFLKEKGIELTLSEVESLAGGAIIARPHFARALVKRGYVSSVQEAFDRYLDTEEYARIERPKPSARECLKIIHDAGGKASLAHPYQIGLENHGLEKLASELASDGLDAIECYYPRYTPEQTDFYLYLAQTYHLHITGGSDFHGERVKPDISLCQNLSLDIAWLQK